MTPYEHTAFGGFWKAINLHFERLGLPELGFRDARDAWDAAVSLGGQRIREHEANGTVSAGSTSRRLPPPRLGRRADERSHAER